MGPGGAKTVKSEQIPDWAWNSPEYWYGRYLELEKAYCDLGQQKYHQSMNQGHTAMSLARDAANNDDVLDELLGLAGIAVSIATITFALRGSGYHSLSSGVILGVSFAGMVLAQRVHLPEALGRIRTTIVSLYRGD